MNTDQDLVGKRIMVVSMIDEPNPIPFGVEGTVYHVGGGVINVQWDNGRNLGLVIGVDKFQIL